MVEDEELPLVMESDQTERASGVLAETGFYQGAGTWAWENPQESD